MADSEKPAKPKRRSTARVKKKPSKAPSRKPKAPPTSTTELLLGHAEQLAQESRAAAILVYADALDGRTWKLPKALRERVIPVIRTEEQLEGLDAFLPQRVIRVPEVVLTRMGQIKVAVFLALSHGLLQAGDQVVCLAGPAAENELDMLRLLEVDREFEFFMGGEDPDTDEETPSNVRPEVLSRVVEIAIDLGSEGREGKPVGTLFVVGDEDTVLPLTNQRILNPFRGYPEDERNVLSIDLEETIKELAGVDGAFMIKGDGTVISSGTYLKTSALPEDTVSQRGMGARHQAAAGITFATNCMAVAVSESTGTVTIFRRGQVVTEIEKPQKARQQKSTRG